MNSKYEIGYQIQMKEPKERKEPEFHIFCRSGKQPKFRIFCKSKGTYYEESASLLSFGIIFKILA